MPQTYTYGQITKGVDIDTPTITINGVTEDNYLDLCKANGIEPIVNANGEIVSWQYTQSESMLTDEGYTERIYKVQMSAKKNSQSTSSNVIIDFVPTEDATTSTRYKGSIQVNVNRNDYAKAILKTAGVNLDLATVPDSVIDEMWDRYLTLAAGDAYMAEPPVEGIDDYAQWLGDMFADGAYTMMQFLKCDTVDQSKFKTVDSVDNLAAILSVCAEMGMFTPDDIFNDNPETKAIMMQAQDNDRIKFALPTDADGNNLLPADSWIPSFLRPMMFASLISGVRQLPYASDFENGFTDDNGILIWERLAQSLYEAEGVYPNYWLSNIQTTGSENIMLMGLYSDDTIEYTILHNYPAYGYANIIISSNDLKTTPYGRGVYYPSTTPYNWGGYITGASQSNCVMIYSFEDFFNYFEGLTTAQQNSFMNGAYFLFANCEYIPGEKDYISYDPDYIHLTPGMTPDDIINILPTERPDWWDDRDTEVTVDPRDPDTPKQKIYLPVGTGNNNPTEGTPDQARIVGGYPLTIPSITVPINTIPEAVNNMDPTAGSSKFWTIYNPLDTEMDSLGGELWQQNVIQTLKQTFVNPTDGIISWHQIFLNPAAQGITVHLSTQKTHIMLGDYQTGVESYYFIDNTAVIQCGSVTVPTYYGDYRDYTETEVSCYLPYIGFVTLDPRDVIGGKLSIVYRIDLLTGMCVANISPTKGGPNDNNVSDCAYMFTGNCAIELPITAADRSRFFSGMLNGAMSGFTTGGGLGGPIGSAVGAVAGGIIGGVEGLHGGVVKCNGLNGNAGALSIHSKPYLLIQRNKPADPLGAEYHYGAPASKLMILREAHGFTRVREAYINIPRATENEKAAIDTILKTGIYLS